MLLSVNLGILACILKQNLLTFLFVHLVIIIWYQPIKSDSAVLSYIVGIIVWSSYPKLDTRISVRPSVRTSSSVTLRGPPLDSEEEEKFFKMFRFWGEKK